jgi:glutathione S-transferase
MQTFMFPACAWITLVALFTYIWTISKAGKARITYNIPAPAMDGPPGFLAAQRVQANTLEQMIVFLPALWLCALIWQNDYAAIAGGIWVIGRIMYALAYYQDPAKRGPGFMISTLAAIGLMLASAAGLVWGMINI